MASSLPILADAQNKFEDLSGVDISAYVNPYDALIEATNNDPAQMQARYSTHRTTRNAQQKEKLLADDFQGLIIDPILLRLEDQSIEPGFTDPRHCMVFWARPPKHIRDLIVKVQEELKSVAPKLWLMPSERQHLTALEVTHSLTQPEINTIVSTIGTETILNITDFTFSHRARLVKPLISYDGQALALSFLPAAGEGLSPSSSSSSSSSRTQEDDVFTYHHLRKHLFDLANAKFSINSRYVVPSSHITIGRFLTQEDHDSREKMEVFLDKVEAVNEWLQKEHWYRDGEEERDEMKEWVVGEEKGLDCRVGRLWYGGGETVKIGKGF